MFVGLLELDLLLHYSKSLKDKRQHVRSLTHQLNKKFHLSVSEVGYHDLWQRSLIGVAVVGGEVHHLRTVLQNVAKWSGANWPGDILSDHIHIFSTEGDL